MLVQCPICRTTYRVSENLVAIPKPTFRCSRCKHIFVPGTETEASSARKDRSPPPPAPEREEQDDPELSFSFSQRERVEIKEEEKEEEIPPSHTVEEKAPAPAVTKGEDWAFPSNAPASEQPFTIVESPVRLETDKPAEARLDFEKDWQAPYRAGPTFAYLTLCGALLLFYGLLTFTHQTQPGDVENFIKGIPWLGSWMLRNDHLRQGIALRSLRPGFLTITGNRQVFVVSGVAVNRNPVSVRQVRVEGHIYNTEGKEIETQAISLGNAISAKILRDLTAQDISTLQRLNPPKRFEISPDQSVGFVIVFLRPTPDVKNFSLRVLSVEAAA